MDWNIFGCISIFPWLHPCMWNVNSVSSDVSEFDPIEIFNKRCHLRLPGKCWEWQPGKKDSVEWKMGTSKNQEQQHWHKIFSRKYFLKIVLFPVAVGCHDAFILLSEMSSLWYWSLFVAHHWLRFLVSTELQRWENIFQLLIWQKTFWDVSNQWMIGIRSPELFQWLQPLPGDQLSQDYQFRISYFLDCLTSMFICLSSHWSLSSFVVGGASSWLLTPSLGTHLQTWHGRTGWAGSQYYSCGLTNPDDDDAAEDDLL